MTAKKLLSNGNACLFSLYVSVIISLEELKKLLKLYKLFGWIPTGNLCFTSSTVHKLNKILFEKGGVVNDPNRFKCDLCAAFYPTRQGLVWHRFREYNCRAPPKSLIKGTTCISCLNEYFTRIRLYTHLMGPGSRCINTYFQTQAPMPADELEALEAEAREAHRALRKIGV